ncbi:hypothetical protein PIIN_04999 [Serendipita indica DSM 11827]|uniref:Uncharacterized protein n=1 Tax=Serendipita indica (strain DSM 11827) TaxID=1109443 RepID=G4TIB7_SERID|nr:hypothetical protein PIIN_04999 [Serendipita indica DSM 11827]
MSAEWTEQSKIAFPACKEATQSPQVTRRSAPRPPAAVRPDQIFGDELYQRANRKIMKGTTMPKA